VQDHALRSEERGGNPNRRGEEKTKTGILLKTMVKGPEKHGQENSDSKAGSAGILKKNSKAGVGREPPQTPK